MNGEMDERLTVDRWIERMDGKDGWMDKGINGRRERWMD